MAHNKRPKSKAKDRTKQGPTARRDDRPPKGSRERLGLVGLLVTVLFGAVVVAGGVGLFGYVFGEFRKSAELTGRSGQLHVTSCWRRTGPRSSGFHCEGDVTPHSATPLVGHGKAVINYRNHDERGQDLRVDCDPTGYCTEAGPHAALTNVLFLHLPVAIIGVGFGLMGGALAGRWPRLRSLYEKRVSRIAGWGLAGLGVSALGVLLAILST